MFYLFYHRAVVTAPTANLSACRLIRTYSVARRQYNETIVNAMLAALATPPLFHPVRIGWGWERQEHVISGSMGFNNPTKEAIEEAKRIFGEDRSISVIINLGSGLQNPPRLDSSTTNELYETLGNIVCDSEKVADELSRRFAHSSIYHRFSVDRGMESRAPTAWEEDVLANICTQTKAYIERISLSLDAAIEPFSSKVSSLTLGQVGESGLSWNSK